MKEGIITTWRRAWPVVFLFFVLGITPLVVGEFFGRGWRLSIGVFVVVLWLVFRPWRFGLASPGERKQAAVGGTIGLAGLVLNYAVTYFKW
jgi:hypothetical protein